MIRRPAIIAAARSWVGTPYQHQGREKGRAIDCIGLIWGVAREVGYEQTVPSAYSPTPAAKFVEAQIEGKLERQNRDRDSLAEGDIVVLWGLNRNGAQHFAFVGADPGRFTLIHALSHYKKVLEHGLDRQWHRRIMAVYNFPGTEPL